MTRNTWVDVGIIVYITASLTGCAGSVSVGNGGNADSDTGTLRAGQYVGVESCDQMITDSPDGPSEETVDGPAAISISDEGYPIFRDWLFQLRPGAFLVDDLSDGTISVRVTDYSSSAGNVTVDVQVEQTICADTCSELGFPNGVARRAEDNNGKCEEMDLCDGRAICDSDTGSQLFTPCASGSDCTDCQDFLGEVTITTRHTFTYAQPSPSSLVVDTATTIEQSRPYTRIVRTCRNQAVKPPSE